MNSKPLLVAILSLALLTTACGPKKIRTPERPLEFKATIHNVSEASSIPTALSPGVWAIHTEPYPMYQAKKPDRDQGLESLAEDGVPDVLLANLLKMVDVAAAGIFDTPSDSKEPGPLAPGSSYTFTFRAMPGDYLSFATMFLQSNDLFFGSPCTGIPLFDEGAPLSGDITALVRLWDCGTEVNEVPGIGHYQAPRQKGPDMGAPEYLKVHVAIGEYPDVTDMIRVTIEPTTASTPHPPPMDIP
ncbi:hypothetical protein DSLASN_35340 [Desulfoluna limicola]|uniref:Spondin domain-containing protein n=1 Tax=Desulfoluna limicola TaxID=2810562 RepID=A0ABN6F6A3_9BACT|nr:spondin domain-containing protein [Desulfoluna limicola]BCS97902.1 hypothetical protein DSLASN_35340 [Desulfoluna limicola]